LKDRSFLPRISNARAINSRLAVIISASIPGIEKLAIDIVQHISIKYLSVVYVIALESTIKQPARESAYFTSSPPWSVSYTETFDQQTHKKKKKRHSKPISGDRSISSERKQQSLSFVDFEQLTKVEMSDLTIEITGSLSLFSAKK